jgi:hypothetical protein
MQEWSSRGYARTAGSLDAKAPAKARNKHRSTLISDDSGLRFDNVAGSGVFLQGEPRRVGYEQVTADGSAAGDGDFERTEEESA